MQSLGALDDASDQRGTIEGEWSSRWNGAADPTIPGDAPDKWKQGRGEAKIVGDRVYLLFDWDSGKRRGLIDARREGPRRLVGKYINLNNPEITVPWVGLVVSDQRIDVTQGRVDSQMTVSDALPCPRPPQRLRQLTEGADEGAAHPSLDMPV